MQLDNVIPFQRRRSDTHLAQLLPFQGAYPALSASTWVAPSAVVIGDVHLAENVSIWPGAVIRSDGAPVSIGANSNIQDLCCLHSTPEDEGGTGIVIGENVTVGHGVVLHGCRLEDECLIGCRSVVLDGVTIEPQVVVGAGSIVPYGRTLESGWLYLGAPAKAVRRLTAKEIAHFRRSANNYVTLAQAHKASAEGRMPLSVDSASRQ